MIDYSGASEVLQNGLSFLATLGFDKSTVSTEQSKLAGHSLLLGYKSSIALRRIELSYLYSQLGRPGTIIVGIFSGDGDSFSLEDWLRAKEKKIDYNFFINHDPVRKEYDFIKKFIRTFEKLCEHDLKETLLGNEWEPIPFDWKGYK